jgi:IS605 OrfB family transposase
LTRKKSKTLDGVISEYLRVLNATAKHLPAKSSTELHHKTYSGIRKTSFLPSDIVQEARKDVWKSRKKLRNGFRNCSIRLNKRWFKFTASKRNNPVFSITYSPKKKLLIPVAMDRQFQRFKSFLNDGWLFDTVSLLKDGRISVAFEKGFPHPEINQKYVLGVDIGSSTLAAVSIFDIKTSRIVKQLYFGRDVAERQRKYLERKAKLQSLADNGSGKAKKSLRKLKHKQFNFVKTRSGQVAKEIINLAKRYDASISIEKFKNIRVKRGRFRKDANRKINRIPYGKFKEFLFSNAEMLGIPLKEVDAYHTSKWCSACGAVNNGHYSGNYALYKCKVCGKIVNSDRKASLAIAVKSLLERENHELTIPDFAQISNRRVPVNGLMRPDAVGLPNVAVQHANQPMESHPIY